MEIRRKIVCVQQARYLKATMGVRYYVDCEYSTDNGKTWNKNFEDTEEESERIKKLTPCVVKDNIGCTTKIAETTCGVMCVNK